MSVYIRSDLDKHSCRIYCCRFGQFTWEDHRPRNGAWKGTRGGQAYSFSGCDDHQTSADTSVLFTLCDVCCCHGLLATFAFTANVLVDLYGLKFVLTEQWGTHPLEIVWNAYGVLKSYGALTYISLTVVNFSSLRLCQGSHLRAQWPFVSFKRLSEGMPKRMGVCCAPCVMPFEQLTWTPEWGRGLLQACWRCWYQAVVPVVVSLRYNIGVFWDEHLRHADPLT